MAAYQLELTRSATKDLEALSAAVGPRITAAISRLAEEQRPKGYRKLAGTEDSYRIGVGDYRILYQVSDRSRVVTVYAIGHRRDVYR